MKNNWQTKKIGEIAEIKGGKRIPKGFNLQMEETEHPYIRVADFNDNGSVNLEGIRYIDAIIYEQIKRYTISSNDLYISIAGTIGKTGIIPKKLDGANLTENACKLVFKDAVDTKFIYYFTKTEDFLNQAGLNTRVAAMPKLALQRLSTINIRIPESIEEQKRIVKTLDELFEKIEKAKENAEKNLQNSRELFESYLLSIFIMPEKDWELCTLEKYVKFIDYRGRTPKKTKGGLRLITAKNVKNGFLQKHPEEFVDPQIYDSWMTRGIPNKGDVLFTTEAPLANVAQLDIDEKVAFAQRIIILQPQINKLDQTFLKYLLFSKPIKQVILDKGTGATVQGIKASLLKKIEIYFPKSLSKQKEIVKKLDELSEQTRRLEEIYRQKLADLEELKKSVLDKAFKGEL